MMDVSSWHEDLQKKVDESRICIQSLQRKHRGETMLRCKEHPHRKSPVVTESSQLVAVSARDIDMPRIPCLARPVLR